MNLGISGKRALVLASSQGLGLGIATKLCEEGAHVLICGRVEGKLAAAAASLNETGPGKADYTVVDLSDADAARNLYKSAKEKLGAVEHGRPSARNRGST
jgi:3-oxoacyl-[acyl-carrier protein] reductase